MIPDGVGVIGVCFRGVDRELSDRFLSILPPREWGGNWRGSDPRSANDRGIDTAHP